MNQVALFSGGFHPFHPGHKKAFEWAVDKFGDCFVVSTNSTTNRPFTFIQKQYLANVSGIPKDHFIQVEKPYSPDEALRQLSLNPADTACIYIISEKDKDRFDDQDYFKTYKEKETLVPASTNAYVCICPEFTFDLLGKESTDASDIRDTYPKVNEEMKNKLVKELYPHTDSLHLKSIREMFDSVLGKKTFKSFQEESNNESVN